MNQLPSKWTCDKCFQLIESVRDGWVEWLKVDDIMNDEASYTCEGLRLVHAFRENRPKCTYVGRELMPNVTTSDGSLRGFVGGDGLMKLLSMAASTQFSNKSEVIELIKRIHVPGYEEARNYLQAAADEGVYHVNTPDGFPDQDQICAVLDWVKDKQ